MTETKENKKPAPVGQMRLSEAVENAVKAEIVRLEAIERRNITRQELAERMWDAYQRVVMNTPKVDGVPEGIAPDVSAGVRSNASELLLVQVKELLQALPDAVASKIQRQADGNRSTSTPLSDEDLRIALEETRALKTGVARMERAIDDISRDMGELRRQGEGGGRRGPKRA